MGTNNVALGGYTLYANTTGIGNVAILTGALSNNTSGIENFAVGCNSMYGNISGSGNFAAGNRALACNTTGCNNIAIGCYALANAVTGENVALGMYVLYNNTSGTNNIGAGCMALGCNIGGSANIGLGWLAGCTNTSGSNNIFLGCNAQGLGATCSNTITLGNSSIGSIRAQVTSITALSDARDKKDIVDIPLGLDFIRQIRPVKFTWNMRDGSKVGQGYAGFIAQELKQVMDYNQVKDWLELVVSNEDESRYEASPGKLLPVMVRAIQELAEELDKVKAELATIKGKV